MPKQPWYVDDRAESLARVFLTGPRTETLVEQRRHSDSEVDLVLAVTPINGAPYKVAVDLMGYDGDRTPIKDLRVSRSMLTRARRSDLPTLLLAVDARTGGFHCAWLKLNGESPSSPEQIHFRPLQTQADLERILIEPTTHAVPA